MGDKLPTPRLQLRWAPAEPNEHRYEWACHYELVIQLREHDIRGERVDAEGNRLPDLTEIAVAMTTPTLRGTEQVPCTGTDGSRYLDAPFRDGAHAAWDAAALGGLPVYVIAPDGMAFKKEARR